MYVSLFSPYSAPGVSAVAVSTVLENRVPNRGTPSSSTLDRAMTFPSWISLAAAFVTAGVIRLVAPVWSPGPNGDGATSFEQSLCANTGTAERQLTSAATGNKIRLLIALPPQQLFM